MHDQAVWFLPQLAAFPQLLIDILARGVLRFLFSISSPSNIFATRSSVCAWFERGTFLVG